MYMTVNSASVWKRVADENQQSAQLLARVSIGLLLLTVVIGGFAYMEHKQNGEMCAAIRTDALAHSAEQVKDFGSDILASYCN